MGSNRTLHTDLPSTSWSLLAAANDADGAADTAVAEIALRYYRPVAAYLTALARDPDRGHDLTQSFFAERVLSKQVLLGARAERGSFRRYLMRAVRNYFVDSYRHEARARRGGSGAHDVDLGAVDAPDATVFGSPERAFHSAWVRNLLDHTLTQVEGLCREKGQEQHFALFAGRYLTETFPPPSWQDLGAAHDLDEKAARGRAETVARHLQKCLRGALQMELGDAATVDQELAILRALLER